MDDPQRQTFNESSENPVESEPRQSFESLSRSVERAEETIRALESENRNLQRDLTKAILAAARQENAQREDTELSSDEAKQRFEGLTSGMKIAEAARSEAARERKSAIRAVEEALRHEYAQRIGAIQHSHAAELAALSHAALQRARGDVANELDTLTRDVSEARQELDRAKRDHERNLRETEELFVEKFSQQIDEMERTHAETLEKLSRLHKEQFAEELMQSLSAAHEAWEEETKAQVQQARQKAEKIAARDRSRLQRHNRSTMRRAARVWWVRERRRLSDKRREWRDTHRQALDDCNIRWRAKFNRRKRWARRIGWPSEQWRRYRDRVVCFWSSYTQSARCEISTRYGNLQSPAHGGVMAVLLVFLGVNFSFPPVVPAKDRLAEPTAASARSASETELAALPRDRSDHGKAWPLNPRSYSAAVEMMQRDLKRKGYNPGPVDGVLGPKTRAAITRYMSDQTGKGQPQLYRPAKGAEIMASTTEPDRRN